MMIGSLLSNRDKLPASNRLWACRKVVMGFSYLLSPTAPAPRTRCLGSTVARFARPFEARPVDPPRQKSYSQLLESCTAATTLGWLAPTGCSATVPPPLDPGWEDCSESPIPSVKKRKKRKTVK